MKRQILALLILTSCANAEGLITAAQARSRAATAEARRDKQEKNMMLVSINADIKQAMEDGQTEVNTRVLDKWLDFIKQHFQPLGYEIIEVESLESGYTILYISWGKDK